MPSESTVSAACPQSPTIRSAAPNSTPYESRLKHKSSRSERARPADNAMDGLKGARRGMSSSESPAPLLHPARHSCTPSSSADAIADAVKAYDGLCSGKITHGQVCDTCICHAGSAKIGAAHAELSCWHPGHCLPSSGFSVTGELSVRKEAQLQECARNHKLCTVSFSRMTP